MEICSSSIMAGLLFRSHLYPMKLVAMVTNVLHSPDRSQPGGQNSTAESKAFASNAFIAVSQFKSLRS